MRRPAFEDRPIDTRLVRRHKAGDVAGMAGDDNLSPALHQIEQFGQLGLGFVGADGPRGLAEFDYHRI